MITIWTAVLSEVLEIERLLGTHLPWLEIRDSGINFRTAKRVGWLLDARGYATGEVVVPTALAPAPDGTPTSYTREPR